MSCGSALLHVCVPVAVAATETHAALQFRFDELEVIPAAQPQGVAPVGTPIVHTRVALTAPCAIPCFGRVMPAPAPGAAAATAYLYPARCSTRPDTMLDGGTDIEPATLPRSAAVVDCAPSCNPVVGLRGLAIFPYVREPTAAQTLACSAYLDDAGAAWATQPEYAALLAFMTEHWAVLQPMLHCATPAEYPLAVLRVVADVPAHSELLAMINGFCFLGRRSVSSRSTALKTPEGVALLRSSRTSMADVRRMLDSQLAVNASAYRTLLTAEATSALRAEQQRAALVALRAAIASSSASTSSLPMLLPSARPASMVQLPEAAVPCAPLKRQRSEGAAVSAAAHAHAHAPCFGAADASAADAAFDDPPPQKRAARTRSSRSRPRAQKSKAVADANDGDGFIDADAAVTAAAAAADSAYFYDGGANTNTNINTEIADLAPLTTFSALAAIDTFRLPETGTYTAGFAFSPAGTFSDFFKCADSSSNGAAGVASELGLQ